MGMILGRDLPFCNKGRMVYEKLNTLYVVDRDGKERFIGYSDFLKDYVNEGWIEAVSLNEPRRYKIFMYHDGRYGMEGCSASPLKEIINVIEIPK